MPRLILIFLSVFALNLPTFAQVVPAPIDLSGPWAVLLDSEAQMDISSAEKTQQWQQARLPGSIDEAGLCAETGTTSAASENVKVADLQEFPALVRKKQFLGPVWWKKTISIPPDWRGKRAELLLERVMWQSQVFLDGKKIGGMDSLSTSHVFDLGDLAPGNHSLVLRIDNRMIHPIGNQSIGYGEQSQTRWNGIVGKLELRVTEFVRPTKMRIFPDLEKKSLSVEVLLANQTSVRAETPVYLGILSPQKTLLASVKSEVLLIPAKGTVSTKLTAKLPETRAWNQFEQPIYSAIVSLQPIDAKFIGKFYPSNLTGPGLTSLSSLCSTFAFRSITYDNQFISINGERTFLRGNIDCCQFPLTGYPATDLATWRKIFSQYKSHNFNHIRFHSWCPPEAAFVAADELGLLLQIETPASIDAWMEKQNKTKSLDVEGHPKGLGLGDRSIDTFTRVEARRILDEFGNHPSFGLFCIGNELGSSNGEVLAQWIHEWKNDDPRRLYLASANKKITIADDLLITRRTPSNEQVCGVFRDDTDWDFERGYRGTALPTVAHAIGRWPVHPLWSEAQKFSGLLQNPRLEKMASLAKKNGVFEQDEEFQKASLAMNQMLTCEEIESVLRSASCAGFQLFSMQDFTGQGEAYTGWLDCFYQLKDRASTKSPAFSEVKRLCDQVVVLARLPRFVWTANGAFYFSAAVRNNSPESLKQGVLKWKLVSETGTTLASGSKKLNHEIVSGELSDGHAFSCQLSTQDKPITAILQLEFAGVQNSRKLWIYPNTSSSNSPKNVVVTNVWRDAEKGLAKGNKVLFLATASPSFAKKPAFWRPLFASSVFYQDQSQKTFGHLVRKNHLAFQQFPTSFFTEWQWMAVFENASEFDLTDIKDIKNQSLSGFLVQAVPDFHTSRKLSSLFELKAGPGHLLVCGHDLSVETCAQSPQAAQLRTSLLAYLASPQTRACSLQELSKEALQKLFASSPQTEEQPPQK